MIIRHWAQMIRAPPSAQKQPCHPLSFPLVTACRSYSFAHDTRPRRAALSRHLPHAIGLAEHQRSPLSLPRTPALRGLAQRADIPPNGPSLKALKENTGHRAQANHREGLDRASRAASEAQMTPSVTRGDATSRHADSTNNPICPANAASGTLVQGMACCRWREHEGDQRAPPGKSHRGIRALSVP